MIFRKTSLLINIILFTLSILLYVPGISFFPGAFQIEIFLIILSYIWTPISDFINYKKFNNKSIPTLVTLILYHIIMTILLMSILISASLGYVFTIATISLLTYLVSIIYIVNQKKKLENKVGFFDKFKVNYMWSIIALTVSIVTISFYTRFAQIAFCFQAMNYYGISAIIRVIIFFTLLLVTLFSLIVFILGIKNKLKNNGKLYHSILPIVGEVLLTIIMVFVVIPGSISFYPRGNVNIDDPYAKTIVLEKNNKKYTAIYLDNNYEYITIFFVGNSMSAYDGYFPYSYGFSQGDSNSNLLIIDYPMFGNSKAALTEKNLYEEAELFYEYIINDLGYSNDRITIAGYSIGTGIANYLASKHEVKNLILAAPYNNFTDEMNSITNVFYPPLSWTIQYKLPSDEYAKNINCPVTIVASIYDQTVPYELSKKLSYSYPNEVTFITLDHGGHGYVFVSEEFISLMFNK